MKPSEHVIYGALGTSLLIPSYHSRAALFFLGSIFIDVDHYVDFLYYGRFRNWSIKGMLKFHGVLSRWKDRDGFLALEAFHTVEFLTALLLLSVYFKSTELYLVFAGMIFHLTLDLIRLRQ